MQSRRLSEENGFSLVEVVVAIAILTTALLTLAQLLAMTLTANASTGRATYLTALAAQKIEDLQAVPWEWLDSNTGTFTDHLDRTGAVIADDSALVVFTRRWSVAPWPSDPSNTHVIDVTVGAALDETRLASVRTRMLP